MASSVRTASAAGSVGSAAIIASVSSDTSTLRSVDVPWGVAHLVSVKGETRAERSVSSESLWRWIDEHGKEFGIGRPYLDKDPPHVAPIDGKEYVDHREAHALACGATATHFAAVIRPEQHPAKPAGYVPLDGFWRKRGYAPLPGFVTQLAWKEHGEEGESLKPMQYWLRKP